jgi:hypothetical protein
LPGINHILAEIIEARDEPLCSEIQKLKNSVWNKEELPQQWKDSIIIPVYKKGNKTDCSNYGGIPFFQIYTVFHPISFSQS